jgi:hypothetical protein
MGSVFKVFYVSCLTFVTNTLIFHAKYTSIDR